MSLVGAGMAPNPFSEMQGLMAELQRMQQAPIVRTPANPCAQVQCPAPPPAV